MPSLTVRNIPNPLMARLRALSASERRSINNEVLVLLDAGLTREAETGGRLSRPPTDIPVQLEWL